MAHKAIGTIEIPNSQNGSSGHGVFDPKSCRTSSSIPNVIASRLSTTTSGETSLTQHPLARERHLDERA
jgi:hypothetical protein